MINQKGNINYYLINRIKPIEISYYVTLKPIYLEKFKKKENISCRVHGNHKDWALRNKGSFKKNPSIRCKLCANLCAKYWQRTRKIKSLFKDAKRHAKDDNSIFTIKISDIFNQLKKQKLRCNISNIKFDKFINRVSIDKISPPKGYTKKNIQFLTNQINRMKNKFDQKYFINLCKDIYKFRVLKKGKYGRPIYNFDYEKELIMGTSTAYGVKLRINRLKNNQTLFCKKHRFHKLFRIDKSNSGVFVRCIKCDRERSLEYKKKIKLDPDFNKKRKQIE